MIKIDGCFVVLVLVKKKNCYFPLAVIKMPTCSGHDTERAMSTWFGSLFSKKITKI